MNRYEIVLRIIIAIIIGGIIGSTRENKNRPAGFRTHILVCLGATIVGILEIEIISMIKNQIGNNIDLGNVVTINTGRLAAQVISGVGFLGAGTILRNKEGAVKGLTTAASIWIVAVMGLAIGYGMYFLSICSLLAGFFVIILLKKFRNKWMEKNKRIKFEIKYKDVKAIKKINEILEKEKKIKIISIKILKNKKTIIYYFDKKSKISIKRVIDKLIESEYIKGISIKNVS